MKITDRESLAGAILANSDAAALFYYGCNLLECYIEYRRDTDAGAIAGIIVAIHQILNGNTDYDGEFSICINDLMQLCIDNR